MSAASASIYCVQLVGAGSRVTLATNPPRPHCAAVVPMAERQNRKRARSIIGVALAIGVPCAGLYAWFGVPGRIIGPGTAVAPPPALPIPVTSGTVAIENFPIYRLGIGTVQAFNTVTIRV